MGLLTKTVLPVADLGAILDSVFAYNRRGQVLALTFFDANGQGLPVAWVEAVSEDTGLAVRTRPEPTPEEAALATGSRPIPDARSVAPPQSMEELSRG